MIIYFRLIARRFRHPPAPFKVGLLLLALLAYGSTGFLYFELPNNPQLSWVDGIWYAIVTVTTVGYGDLSPASLGGRFLVAVPLMLLGIGLLGYVLGLAASALVEAKGKEIRGMAQLKVSDHLILINYPNLEKVARVLAELKADPEFATGSPIVLVDEDLEELPTALAAQHLLFVRGNPTQEETLLRACVDTAKRALVLSKNPGKSESDHRNVAITLTIEARWPRVGTTVECVDSTTQELLRKAGCDGIVCTSRFDAHFLAHELLNPGVQEVIDELTSSLRGQQIYLTPYDTSKPAPFSEVAVRCSAAGHIAIGLRRGGQPHLNVSASFQVEPQDTLITIGQQRLTLS